MTSKEIVDKILPLAISAPSGENSQPWRFKLGEAEIELWNDPESDLSYYNFNQFGSYIAHGAAIENIVITASSLGYESSVELFPNSEDQNFVARIRFEKSDINTDPLFKFIEKRITNRKAYDGKLLNDDERDSLLQSGFFYGGKFRLEEDKEKIKMLADAGSSNEIIMLSNHFVHNFFFTHVRWTQEEDRKTPNGFYVKTLELTPQQEKGFKLFSKWKILHLLNKLGIAKLVAKENAKVYATASAYGIITIPNYSLSNFVEAGRKLQRVWLTATSRGLWMQPISGSLFLGHNLLLGEPENFSYFESETLKNALKSIREVFHMDSEEIPAMMFRIGKSVPPSAQSSRFSIDSFIIGK